MTEEKKSLSPEVKWGIAYLVYVLICILACYGAGAVQQAMRHQTAVTFQQFPYMWVSFAAFVVLGVLWAVEGLLASKVRKIVMLPVRVVAIFLLCVMSFGGLLGIGVSSHAYTVLSWITNMLALLIGWLAIDTVARVFRKR